MGCFHLLATVNKTAMSMGVQLFLRDCQFFRLCIPRSGIAGLRGNLFLIFQRKTVVRTICFILHSHQRPRAAGFSTSLLTLSGGRTAYNWNLSCTLALPDMIYRYIYIYIYIYTMGLQRVRHDWATELNWYYEVGSVCVCLSSQLYWRIRILFFTLFDPQYSVQDVYTAGPKVLCRCSNICWVNKKKMNHLNLTEKERGEIGWM